MDTLAYTQWALASEAGDRDTSAVTEAVTDTATWLQGLDPFPAATQAFVQDLVQGLVGSIAWRSLSSEGWQRWLRLVLAVAVLTTATLPIGASWATTAATSGPSPIAAKPQAASQPIATTPQPTQKASQKASESIGQRALSLGYTSAEVAQVQRQLANLGYFHGQASGYFDRATRTAVQQFQADRGLTIDGRVGDRTRAVLAQTQTQAKSTPAKATSAQPAEELRGGSGGGGYGYQPGMTPEAMRRANAQPARLKPSNCAPYFTPWTTGYRFDYRQAAYLPLHPTGRPVQPISVYPGQGWGGGGVGSVTAAGGANPCSRCVGGYNPNTLSLQKRLQQLGYFRGQPTGYFGPITESAVRRFQRDRGLRADGIAGPQTKAALGLGA